MYFLPICKYAVLPVHYRAGRNNRELSSSLVTIYISIFNFNDSSKVYKFPGHEFSHSIFNTFSTNFHIFKVQTLKFRNIKFEKNCSYIGGVYTSLVAIYIGIFKLVEYSDLG